MKNILLIALVALVATIRCTHDKALPSGFEDLQRSYEGEVRTAEFSAVADGHFWQEPVAGLYPTLLFGKTSQVQSYLVLQFSDFTGIDTARVKSMTVYLHQIQRYGSGPAFTAIVHPMTAEWTESSVTWSTVAGLYLRSEEWSRFQVPDADTGWVSFTLDSSRVNDWIKGTQANHGLLIDFSQADFMAVLNSSDSDTSQAYSRIIYTTKAGILDTVTIKASKDASLLSNLRPLTKNELEKNQDRLYIDNAAGYRTLLRFNLDSLAANATIHQAVLTLQVDTESSHTLTGGMSITCNAVVSDSLWQPETLRTDTLATYPVAYGFADQSAIRFVGGTAATAMATIVQNWVLKNPANFGMILTGTYGADAQHISLYSGKDRPEFKPKLYLTYSLPPSSKF